VSSFICFYLDEQTLDSTLREGKDADRFYRSGKGLSPENVTYDELTGKKPAREAATTQA